LTGMSLFTTFIVGYSDMIVKDVLEFGQRRMLQPLVP
jgi:hypothetical protein